MVRNVILWIIWYSELTNFELMTFSCTPELLLCIHFLTKINFIYIYRSFATTLSQQQCHNIVTTAASQHCHNSSVTTTLSQQQCHKNSVTTTVSQLKICDLAGEKFKCFEVFYQCTDNIPALQGRVLQTVLWYYTF